MTGWQPDSPEQERLYRRLLLPLAVGQKGLLRELRVYPCNLAVVLGEVVPSATGRGTKKVRFSEEAEPYLLSLYRETRMSVGGVAHSTAPLRAWTVA